MAKKSLIKTTKDIQDLRVGGSKLAVIFELLEKSVKPGVSLLELDKLATKKAKASGAKPSFLNYQGFPYGLCASVNEAVVHGLPTSYRLREGDVVGLDFGLEYKGLFTDMARTFAVGKVSIKNQKLIKVTKQSLRVGLRQIKPGRTTGDIGAAIEEYVENQGFSVVRTLVGHGVGYAVHEEPKVPNYGQRREGVKLKTGMVLAIEPMVNSGEHYVKTAKDGFTVITVDGKVSAHWEDTVLVTKFGCEVLTKM